MKLKFVKLVRVPITVEMPDGSTRDGYRYMDIDGNILAESMKGEVYLRLSGNWSWKSSWRPNKNRKSGRQRPRQSRRHRLNGMP